MPMISIDPQTEIFVHDDAVAGAVVTLTIEITSLAGLRQEAERVYVTNEAKIGSRPTDGEIDAEFGTPDDPDIEGCLNFLFPSRIFPGGDVMDVEIKVAKVQRP